MSDKPFISEVKNEEILTKDDIIRLRKYRDNLVKFMEEEPTFKNSRLQDRRQQKQSLLLEEIISQTRFLKNHNTINNY